MKNDINHFRPTIGRHVRCIPEFKQSNWIAVDLTGEIYGYQYSPKYYSNGWSQSIEHPELAVYTAYYGTIDNFKPIENIKKYVFKKQDVIDSLGYDFEDIVNIIDGNILFDAYKAMLDRVAVDGELDEWWIASNDNGNTYAFDTEPYISSGRYSSNGTGYYLGNFKYLTMSWNDMWKLSRMKVQDVFHYLDGNGFIKPKKVEMATKTVSTEDTLKYIQEAIRLREYNLVKIQGEIDSLKRAAEILKL
jgi:hypothetical protein